MSFPRYLLAAPSPKRSGTVHLLRFKSYVEFRTYDELEHQIETNDKWKKSLRYANYEVKYKEGEIVRALPRDLSGVPINNIEIVVEILCTDFSTLATRPEEALNSIGVTYCKSISGIPTSPMVFPECTSISADIMLEQVDKVLADVRSGQRNQPGDRIPVHNEGVHQPGSHRRSESHHYA